eukprot:scaffold22080_cov125-Isochrysis_galbana.AAC.3
MTSGCMSPHTIKSLSLPWRERDSIYSPSRKRAHFTSTKCSKARGKEGTSARGKGTTSPSLTKWSIAWGPSHTPFGGMRRLADSYSRCGADRYSALRHNQIILPQRRICVVLHTGVEPPFMSLASLPGA